MNDSVNPSLQKVLSQAPQPLAESYARSGITPSLPMPVMVEAEELMMDLCRQGKQSTSEGTRQMRELLESHGIPWLEEEIRVPEDLSE